MDDLNFKTKYAKKACRFCRHERSVEKVLVAPTGPIRKPWPRKMWVCEECGTRYKVDAAPVKTAKPALVAVT